MTQQDFSQEQNPYVYEKPVSTSRFRKYGSVATLGLLAFGTAFGGNALAASLTTSNTSANTADTETSGINLGVAPIAGALSADSMGSTFTALDVNGSPLPEERQTTAVDPTLSSQFALPSATSTKSPILALPVLPVTDYGNLSSATPSGNYGSQGTAAGGASWGEDDDDRDDDHDDRDEDDDHDDEDED